MSTQIKFCCLSFLILLVFTGCSSSSYDEKNDSPQESAQTIRFNFHSEPSSLDPNLVRDIPSLTTGKMLFDGLMRMTKEGPLPSAASHFEISEDQRTYTFHLRESLWSNGDPVTAQDFEYAWKRALSPRIPSEYAYQLFIIKNGKGAKKGEISIEEIGVHAIDSRTLVVELERPNPFFLQLTAFPICYPICKKVAQTNPNWSSEQGEHFICNGPFRLVKWTHGSELYVEKNPLYWDASNVRLQSIMISMIEDEHTELNMYENDELDWAGSPNSSIPPEALPYLKNACQQELCILPIAGTYSYKFNTQAPPFHSAKIRRAFALAINRNSLIDNILQANQIAATSLLPPCIDEQIKLPILQSHQEQCLHAIALFEEGLAEEGWTRETIPPITLIFSRSEKHQKIAQEVQQTWSRTFGIKISLQSFEWNIFIDKLAKHDYQVGGKGWISDLSDPLSFLEIYTYANDLEFGGNNDTGWEDLEYNQLVDEASKTTDAIRRKELLHQAESILMRDMPIAPLYHSTACYLKKPYVKNVYISELCDLDFKNAYIQR